MAVALVATTISRSQQPKQLQRITMDGSTRVLGSVAQGETFDNTEMHMFSDFQTKKKSQKNLHCQILRRAEELFFNFIKLIQSIHVYIRAQ